MKSKSNKQTPLRKAQSDNDVLILSPDQIQSISQGQKDAREGRILSNRKANSEIKKWLKNL